MALALTGGAAGPFLVGRIACRTPGWSPTPASHPTPYGGRSPWAGHSPGPADRSRPVRGTAVGRRIRRRSAKAKDSGGVYGRGLAPFPPGMPAWGLNRFHPPAVSRDGWLWGRAGLQPSRRSADGSSAPSGCDRSCGSSASPASGGRGLTTVSRPLSSPEGESVVRGLALASFDSAGANGKLPTIMPFDIIADHL